MKHTSPNRPKLFRFVTTVVFSLLLFNTIALNYPVQDDPLSQLLSRVESILFGTTEPVTTSLSSSSSSDSTGTGISPCPDPPPPPPK